MSIVADNYTDLLSVATNVARKILGGGVGSDYASEAEDIGQDTIVVLLKKEMEGQLTHETVFGLADIVAARKAMSHKSVEIRRREIEQEHGAAINRTLTGQSAEALSADPFEAMAVEEMTSRLKGLSPMLSWTVTEYYLNGTKASDMARDQGTTEAVIYKRLQRARDLVTGDTDE